MSVDHHRRDLSVDQQRALKTAASNLEREFDGTFGTETIEGFLHSSYDEFAGRAVVVNHLPLLAERFARQRLRALAKVEGQHDIGVPVVLFLCTHNAGRSQMALGFFNHLAGDRASPGPAARTRRRRSTRRQLPWCASGASTSPPSTPSRGPTRSSAPPISW
jgi:arsenate reductase (thioredoxin)